MKGGLSQMEGEFLCVGADIVAFGKFRCDLSVDTIIYKSAMDRQLDGAAGCTGLDDCVEGRRLSRKAEVKGAACERTRRGQTQKARSESHLENSLHDVPFLC